MIKFHLGIKMISFDVKSLFTNVPLEFTIDISLKRIYDQGEIATSISRDEMRKLLLVCTKSVHFTFNNQIYIQIDGVAMGSPLGPVLAGIFMVELERNIVPKLILHVKSWRCYVDDTISYVKLGSVEIVLTLLNSFHPNIQFTFEEEFEGKIPFLDVNIICNEGSINTSVYRKTTNTDIYINWNAFAPMV